MATNDFYTRTARANSDLENQFLFCLRSDIELTEEDEEYQIYGLANKHQVSTARLRKTLDLLKRRYPTKEAIKVTEEAKK